MFHESHDFPCPCCGYLVFDELPGSFDICPICFWEDDIVQFVFPDLQGGANKPSLYEAQQSFVRTGMIEARFGKCVRSPTESDVRDVEWRPFDPSTDVHLSGSNRKDEHRWSQIKDARDLCLYYWRSDYWLASQQIEREVLRALDQLAPDAREIPAYQLEDMRELAKAGEPGVALENLCTQLCEYDVVVHPDALALIVTAGVAMGIKPEYWEKIRTR